MDLTPVNSSYVHIEWLEEKIGIVRVYDRPVNSLQMAQGIPYIFFTVVQIGADNKALFKGALKFPLRALKLIIRYARMHTDWDMIWWERPSAGYNVLLDLKNQDDGKCRIVKEFYENTLQSDRKARKIDLNEPGSVDLDMLMAAE